MKREAPWCLVLSGGGAKGVYHIGAWKALKELGIPVGGFVGNSIGAVIGAFLAGGKEAELDEIVGHIRMNTLVTVPEGPGAWREVWRSFVRRGGLDTGPQRRLLERHLDEAVIRASGYDLGIVTVNLSDLQPRELFLEDMEPGTLVDYLMATSAFPGFALPEIGGKRYVDGGLWDNLPYDLARSRGWRKVILLDVRGPGRNRRPDFGEGETVYIRRSVNLGGAFDFDPRFLEQFRTLGYLDTLRAFGQLGGWYTFVRPDPGLERRFTDRPPPKLFPRVLAHDPRTLMKLLDCAASILELDRIRAWTYRELAAEVAAAAARDDAEVHRSAGATGLGAAVADAVRSGVLGVTPYRSWLLVQAHFSGPPRKVLERMLIRLHPTLPAGLAYFDRAASFCARLHPRGR